MQLAIQKLCMKLSCCPVSDKAKNNYGLITHFMRYLWLIQFFIIYSHLGFHDLFSGKDDTYCGFTHTFFREWMEHVVVYKKILLISALVRVHGHIIYDSLEP